MSHIPSKLFPEILRRLPAQSLLRFRAVCKLWRRIIDDPCFIRSHSIAQHSSTNFLFRNSKGTHIFSFSWDSLRYGHTSSQSIQITPIKVLDCKEIPGLTDLPLASCNGLFLISCNDIRKSSAIWNPLMREFHVVPEPNPETGLGLLGSGFGYDPVVDDYKVVRIYDELYYGQPGNSTLVYSLKQKSWKKIQDPPRFCDWYCKGLYLNGSVYWITIDYILALNLATEDYRFLAVPPLPGGKSMIYYTESYYNLELSVLDKYLALSYYSSLQGFTVWVMREDEKWMKLFPRRGQAPFQSHNPYHLRPIAYWESKGELVIQGKDMFYWWNSFKGIIKQVTIPLFLKHKCSVQIWSGSLFRLDRSVAAVKRKRSKTRKIPRLKVYVTSESEDYFDCMEDTYDSDW